MTTSDYWLAHLVDSQGINTLEDAMRALENDSDVLALAEKYDEFQKPLKPLPRNHGETIVAGSVLDLSGKMDCRNPQCIIRRVDDLYGRVWHYFDTVVVSGATSRGILGFAQRDVDGFRNYLLRHMQPLMYLRQLGAEEMVIFREKPHWCLDHLPEAAERLGVSKFAELRRDFIDAIMRTRPIRKMTD